MKPVHYLSKELSVFERIKGTAACGLYVHKLYFSDKITNDRAQVTCGNCKRTNIFTQKKSRQICNICGKLVGMNYRGNLHKCNCGNYET